MGVIAKQVPESLDSQNSSRHCLFIPNAGFIKGFERLPPAPAEFGQQLAIIKKVPPQDFRDAEHYVPVGNRLYNFPAQPVAEFNYPLLVA